MTVAEELSLEEWILSTQEKRAELLSYSRSSIPTDPGERQLDISKAIESGEDAGELEADAEAYLIQAEAQAVLQARKEYEDLTASEREKIIKNICRDVRRLRDGMAVVRRAIQNRLFAIQNLNRSA
jgi:hypothetical protein